MRRAIALLPLVLLAALPAASAGAPDRPPVTAGDVRFELASGGVAGPLSPAAQRAIKRGPLPADAAALARAKAQARARAGVTSAPAAPSPQPTIGASRDGLWHPGQSPSDSTGAIGTQRYIETVNAKMGIYDRSLNVLAEDTLQSWWAQPGSTSFNPQVIWDPTTNRFYYTGNTVFSSTDNRLSFGFSKTAAPNNATSDWCHYQVAYGASFPDYPKLGDSTYFAVIGVNVFSGTSFSGSDILAIGKPAAGTACPDASTFEFGIEQDIMAGSTVHFTPVPANGIDGGNGFVLTRPAAIPASALGIFKVTRDAVTGNPIIQNPGNTVSVPIYTAPANAPQRDGTFQLDTGDARLTQAVMAVDPSKGGLPHVWTQHTVFAGAGAGVRWYEINPNVRTVERTGTVQDASLFAFNGAVSPDRVVAGATKAFGNNMILGFNTSSSTTFPAIWMVGKRGDDAVSAFKFVKGSPGRSEDFGCAGSLCRWGAYSAATPDPKASTSATTGRVYLSNTWTVDANMTGGTGGTSWRTWNWSAQP